VSKFDGTSASVLPFCSTERVKARSCDERASTALFFDALFGELGELLSLDDGVAFRKLSFSKHLEVALQRKK